MGHCILECIYYSCHVAVPTVLNYVPKAHERGVCPATARHLQAKVCGHDAHVQGCHALSLAHAYCSFLAPASRAMRTSSRCT